MRFEPVYYEKKNSSDKTGLSIINLEGSAGIVTLWSHPEKYGDKLKNKYTKLFKDDSQLITLTSLYGNGLSQMLANIANNPQIDRIAVTGADTKVFPVFEYLTNFLDGNVSLEDYGGVPMNKVEGGQCYLDAQLDPVMFKNLKVKRFKTSDLEGVANYIFNSKQQDVSESNRVKIKLIEPKFTDFPSNLAGHNIYSKTPLKAWQDVLWHLDRFGRNVEFEKGVRRMLYNLDVSIEDPSFEGNSFLEEWGFSSDALKEYQKDILDGQIPEGGTYSYGNRLNGHFGGDTLEKVADLLRGNSFHRHGFVSLWDSKVDLLKRESSPCFTDAYFFKDVSDDSLMLTASFRTHNAASAWLRNMYGLRAIQEKVADEAGMKPGKINVRSRWIGIDPSDSKITGTLGKIKEKRNVPIDVHDPKGYYLVGNDDKKIVVEHFSPDGVRLEEIVGGSAEEIKDELRQLDGFSSSDHAMWVGMQIADAERKMNK